MSDLIFFLPWMLLAGAVALVLLVPLLIMGTPGQNPAWGLHLEAYLLTAWQATRRSRHVRRGLIFGALLGVLVGGAAVAAAWDHNPQGVFHGEHGIWWVGLGVIAFSWTLAVFAVAAPSGALLSAAASRVRVRIARIRSRAA